jgi:hypothetical protein
MRHWQRIRVMMARAVSDSDTEVATVTVTQCMNASFLRGPGTILVPPTEQGQSRQTWRPRGRLGPSRVPLSQ